MVHFSWTSIKLQNFWWLEHLGTTYGDFANSDVLLIAWRTAGVALTYTLWSVHRNVGNFTSANFRQVQDREVSQKDTNSFVCFHLFPTVFPCFLWDNKIKLPNITLHFVLLEINHKIMCSKSNSCLALLKSVQIHFYLCTNSWNE